MQVNLQVLRQLFEVFFNLQIKKNPELMQQLLAESEIQYFFQDKYSSLF